ncbi:MAG: aldo/keto reductase [Promethearchaeota archaeon]|nr:MAG: aldo/keto reductase [Candidatus Lokiarchaeota archaeon]
MKFRTLGRTGLKVSEIGLGTEYLFRQERKIVNSVLKEAINNGINYFDIVFNISNYIDNISAALKDYREDIIITCHLGSVDEDGRVRRSRNIEECEQTFLDTLSKFGKDYIDIVNLQFVKEREYKSIISPGGLLGLAKKLQEEGKVKFIGLSTHSASIGQKAVRSGNFDIIMNQINFINDGINEREELLKSCKEKNIGFIAIKPFAGGKLLQRNRTVIIAKYQTGGISLKKKMPKDISPIKCLNYVLSQLGVSTTIPGVKDIEELKDILAYFDASEEEKDYSEILTEFENNL